MTTFREFIEKYKITMGCEWTDSNPNMVDDSWAASHYKCVFKCGRRRMTTYFSMGSAHTEEPTAEDVLNALVSDASGFENSVSFEDWAADYGYNTDSRKAEAIYKAVERSTKKLRNFLPDAFSYDELLDCERL